MTMKMWRKNFLAAAVALSAMTGHVYAAETAHTGTGDDELLPSYSLGEVVVTAEAGYRCARRDDRYHGEGNQGQRRGECVRCTIEGRRLRL